MNIGPRNVVEFEHFLSRTQLQLALTELGFRPLSLDELADLPADHIEHREWIFVALTHVAAEELDVSQDLAAYRLPGRLASNLHRAGLGGEGWRDHQRAVTIRKL